MREKVFCFVLMCFALAIEAFGQEPSSQKPKHVIYNGVEAPDLEGITVDGDTLKLSDLRGTYVLIDFWGTWCAPCVAEEPILQRIHEKYTDELTILGIANEKEEDMPSLKAYLEEKGINWPQLIHETVDVIGSVWSLDWAYEVRGYPMKYLIDPEGRIVESRYTKLRTQALQGELENSDLEDTLAEILSKDQE